MNRRVFFKTMFTAPLLTPFLSASVSEKKNYELYLISDKPHRYISFILSEMRKIGVKQGRSFSILSSFPHSEDLRRELRQNGWKNTQTTSRADMIVSARPLFHNVHPSFTLVKNGKILDIRSHKLHSLWLEMNKNSDHSSCLTIATFRNRQPDHFSGRAISLYGDGYKISTLSLEKDISKSFQVREGFTTVVVEDGKALITKSSCRHKICTSTHPVSMAGERIICAPNHFLLEVQGNHAVDTSIG